METHERKGLDDARMIVAWKHGARHDIRLTHGLIIPYSGPQSREAQKIPKII